MTQTSGHAKEDGNRITARVLVVDDDPSIRFVLKETLSRDGHNVTAVESGELALEQMQRQSFDLALIDIRLKGMDGMQLLGHLRQTDPDLAVIVLTAHASLESAVDALRQGAQDYLFKPCKTIALRASVTRVLSERQQTLQNKRLLKQLEQIVHIYHAKDDAPRPSPNVPDNAPRVPDPAMGIDLETIAATPTPNNERFLKRGHFDVDFLRHIIMLNGRLLELSPTEFDLLAYLISEAPRVVSAEELSREVQGYPAESLNSAEIVRFHIYRIRSKIKSLAGRQDLIRTVRGVGYAIDDAGVS